jgi:hypothetical protein
VLFVGKGKLEGGQSNSGLVRLLVVVLAAGICAGRLASSGQDFVLGPPAEGKLAGENGGSVILLDRLTFPDLKCFRSQTANSLYRFA